MIDFKTGVHTICNPIVTINIVVLGLLKGRIGLVEARVKLLFIGRMLFGHHRSKHIVQSDDGGGGGGRLGWRIYYTKETTH